MLRGPWTTLSELLTTSGGKFYWCKDSDIFDALFPMPVYVERRCGGAVLDADGLRSREVATSQITWAAFAWALALASQLVS